MADLGLNQLNDDQLLDLLIEMCAELGQRDPIVRSLAQKSIYSEAERIKVFKESIEEAIAKAKETYETSIREESRQFVRDQVKSGEWTPISSTAEAKMTVETQREARAEMIREVQAALNAPGGSMLWLNIQPSGIAASFMGGGVRQTKTAGGLTKEQAKDLVDYLTRTLLR